MRRIGFLLLLLTGFSVSAIAQQLVITVIEQSTGTGAAGVLVKAGAITGQTDFDGVVTMPVTSYPVHIELSGVGYEPTQQKVSAAGAVKISIFRSRNSLNETVVTGVPRPTRLENALSQYRVITRAENMAQGNITLADALATRLNINVGNDQILGTNTTMQGMRGDKIKILIDGLPVNGREGGNIDMGQLNLNNVERIEMVQGPMSVVYGSDALGGVINLITRKTSKTWEVGAGFNYESIGKYNADFSASRKWGKHQLVIGGGRNYFNGWKEQDTTVGVPHRRLLWKPKEQYLANMAYNYVAKSGFKAHLASDYTREKITNLGDVNPVTGIAFDEYYRTNRLNNRLIMEHKIGKNGRWESRNSYALYSRTRERLSKDMVTLDEKRTEQLGDQDTSRYDDINLRSNYSNILGRLKYDAGYDVLLQFGNSGKIPGGSKYMGDYALYQNFSMAFLKEKLTLQASLRESYNTQYAAPLIYSFQALYTPIKPLQIRASYAKGFRAPTLKEQYLDFVDFNHSIYGNPDLKAEVGAHTQVSMSYQLYEHKNNFVQLIATGFYNDVDNMIALAGIEGNPPTSLERIYTNFAKSRNTIFNLQLEQQWQNFHLVLEYGLNHTFKQDGVYKAYDATEYTARANYYWKWSGLTFNLFYKGVGAQPFVSQSIEGTATVDGQINPYNRMDASIERKFWKKKVQLIAGVKNIFDVQSIDIIGGSGGGGAHTTGATGNLLPRTVFSTLRLNLN